MKKEKKIDYPDRPVWEPLQAAVGDQCREFMFMGRVGTIFLYKHVWTRAYLNLDEEGNAFRFTENGYEPMPLDQAITKVFAMGMENDEE